MLYVALQLKLFTFMMDCKSELSSDINFFHTVVQNQLSRKSFQDSHVMSTSASLMESTSEFTNDKNFVTV